MKAPEGWEHDHAQTPYKNLVRLVDELEDDVDDREIGWLAFRHIPGLGPSSTPQALERARKVGDLGGGS